ncbi:MAG: hypothetical protein R2873_17160 [Caldilineaceae bacterium]|nr:hypothetical protein [Caldilineaceae bacterium]
MPHFYRSGRHLFRIFLILVIAATIFGWWYADLNWRPAAESFQMPTLNEEIDWLNLAAGLVESAIEIFQSATSN